MSPPSEPNPTNPRIDQNVAGDGNQVIGEVSGGQVFGKVDTVIINPPPVQKPTGIPQNLPRSGADTFVGREQILQELHQQLQQTERQSITAIQGMGGIGKTELALQYALTQYQQGTYPSGICWLRARGQDIGTQVVTFAKAQLILSPPDGLDLAAQVSYCWRNWPEGDVLVIVDDVTDYPAVKPYLPPAEPRFRVLLTSRRDWGSSIHSFAVDVLSPEAALELLESLAGADRLVAEPEIAKTLCEWLGYLPLGLELVGRYLDQNQDCTLSKLQERLNGKGVAARALVQQDSSADMTASHESLAAAFELSWDELNPEAQQLAYRLSLYALAPIAWDWIRAGWADADEEDLETWRDQGLLNRSLLRRVGTGRYQLHQLLREFFTAKLAQWAGADELKRSVCQQLVGLAKTLPQTPTRDQILVFAPVVPHLAEAATNLQPWLVDEDLVWPYVGLSRFYYGQGAYVQAEPWDELCLRVTRERLGEEHPAVASSLNNLAELYRAQGRYGEAEPLYVQALELRRRVLGNEHPDVASSLNNLAELYRVQGRYGEAEPLYVQSLELRRRVLGEEHPDVASSLNNLAELYYAQGRYGEAEPLLMQALALGRRVLGEEHPDVATILNNLAKLFFAQGRYGEAESLYVQALELYQHVLGEEHPFVATSLNNLGSLYHSQGRYEEAEPLHLEALVLRRRMLGEEHPDVAVSLNNLAMLYYYQGRYGEAEPLYLQALELGWRVLGEDHPDVAIRLNNLAMLYYHQGRYREAEPLYVQALELRRQLLGEEHPDVANSLSSLALLYDAQGRYEEAEPLYMQALELYRRVLGEDHPYLATSLNNLAYLYDSHGRYGEAEPLYAQALNILVQRLGSEHPNTQTVQGNFRACLSQCLQSGQTDTLSDHPFTQSLLEEIRSQSAQE